MAKFKYNGPLTSVTLSDLGDVILHPGQEVELPSDNPWVVSLRVLGRLVLVDQAPVPGKVSKKTG